MNKSKLNKMKQVRVKRTLYPIKNDEFIEKTKKQIKERYGESALEELKVDKENMIVTFRDQSVNLVDEKEPIDTSCGTVTFRSKDYYFNKDGTDSKSYGEIDSKMVNNNGWTLKCADGSYYVYEIL